MIPEIDKKATGINMRRLMDTRGVKPEDVREYIGLNCTETVYSWLSGKKLPRVIHLYALSAFLKVPMDSIICGNKESYVPKDNIEP